jgi:hypothetical protein
MNYVYEDGLCIGYMRGDQLVRFLTPIKAGFL